MPSLARRSILRNGYLVSPACRGARAYGTPICRNPSHETMPRVKRWCSENLRNAATALRLIRRKSPVSTGISTLVIACSRR